MTHEQIKAKKPEGAIGYYRLKTNEPVYVNDKNEELYPGEKEWWYGITHPGEVRHF